MCHCGAVVQFGAGLVLRGLIQAAPVTPGGTSPFVFLDSGYELLFGQSLLGLARCRGSQCGGGAIAPGWKRATGNDVDRRTAARRFPLSNGTGAAAVDTARNESA